jgi:hypothetical protein
MTNTARIWFQAWQQPPRGHDPLAGRLSAQDEGFDFACLTGRYVSLLLPQSGQSATLLLQGPYTGL